VQEGTSSAVGEQVHSVGSSVELNGDNGGLINYSYPLLPTYVRSFYVGYGNPGTGKKLTVNGFVTGTAGTGTTTERRVSRFLGWEGTVPTTETTKQKRPSFG